MANFMTQMRVDRLNKELDRLDKKIEDLGHKKLGHSPALSGSEVAEVEKHNANISSKITSLERRRAEIQAELSQIPPLTETDKLIKMYEMSYAESRSRKSELPDLKEFAQLKRHDPKAYMDKLDELAHMKSSIDAAYKAYKEFEEAQRKCPRPLTFGELYVYLGREVHDAWCRENNFKFNDPNRADRRWQFLSSEAIGWDEFKKDMKYCSIVVEVNSRNDRLSFKDREHEVFETYKERRSDYVIKTDAEKALIETRRWISLSNQNDIPRFLPDPAHHRYNEPFAPGPDTGWKNVVGEPYRFTETRDGIYLKPSNAAEAVLAQNQLRVAGKDRPYLREFPEPVQNQTISIDQIKQMAEAEVKPEQPSVNREDKGMEI